MAEEVASMLAANVAVGGVIRGAWLVVADRLAAWSPVFLVRGTIHKPARVHLLQQMMIRLWQLMVQLILVKVTGVHPVLHMVMMESNQCDARPGITWATRAPVRRSGRLRVQVCVDCTLSLLGRQAMRGTVARTMLVAGALVVRKWLVAPKSRMAHHLMVAASTLIVFRRMEAARA